MERDLSREDIDKIRAQIREKYTQVAVSPEGRFKYPTGRAGLEALRYDPALIGSLPGPVADAYCGVGNPFSLGEIRTGEAIIDIGCGAGVDTLIAGMLTGPDGKAAGVDIVPEMLRRAEENLEMTGLENVTFRPATGERLPFPDAYFDVAISNGVINLIPDKEAALGEIHRVLKPGGRLMIADQVMTGSVVKDIKDRLSGWFQ
jgi:arsenite methyltransferase